MLPMLYPDRKSTRLNSSHSLPVYYPIYNTEMTTRRIVVTPTICLGKTRIRANPMPPIIHAANALSRSEEHTSELQSLPTRVLSDLQHGNDHPADRSHTNNLSGKN